jgi:hypothetical protein
MCGHAGHSSSTIGIGNVRRRSSLWCRRLIPWACFLFTGNHATPVAPQPTHPPDPGTTLPGCWCCEPGQRPGPGAGRQGRLKKHPPALHPCHPHLCPVAHPAPGPRHLHHHHPAARQQQGGRALRWQPSAGACWGRRTQSLLAAPLLRPAPTGCALPQEQQSAAHAAKGARFGKENSTAEASCLRSSTYMIKGCLAAG